MRAISPIVWGENHHDESRERLSRSFYRLILPLGAWDSLWDTGKKRFGIIQDKGWLGEETKVVEGRKPVGEKRGVRG